MLSFLVAFHLLLFVLSLPQFLLLFFYHVHILLSLQFILFHEVLLFLLQLFNSVINLLPGGCSDFNLIEEFKYIQLMTDLVIIDNLSDNLLMCLFAFSLDSKVQYNILPLTNNLQLLILQTSSISDSLLGLLLLLLLLEVTTVSDQELTHPDLFRIHIILQFLPLFFLDLPPLLFFFQLHEVFHQSHFSLGHPFQLLNILLLDVILSATFSVLSNDLLLLGLDDVHVILSLFLSLFNSRVDVVILDTLALLDTVILQTQHFDVFSQQVYFGPEFLHHLALIVFLFLQGSSLDLQCFQRSSERETIFQILDLLHHLLLFVETHVTISLLVLVLSQHLFQFILLQ